MAPIYPNLRDGGVCGVCGVSKTTYIDRRMFEPEDILLIIPFSFFVYTMASIYKHHKVNKLPIRTVSMYKRHRVNKLPIRTDFIQKQTLK